jgi:N-acetylmuramate 1-kinase
VARKITDIRESIIVTRETMKADFLAAHGWQDAKRDKIPGDASFRRYERLTLQGKTRILMDAPPDKEEVVPFINVAHYLHDQQLNAPEIIAADKEHGFVLLSDFGNDSYTKVLARSGADLEATEITLYEQAIDVLLKLHAAPCPDWVPPYSEELLLREAMLMLEWYYPALNNAPLPEELEREYIAIWKGLLADIHDMPGVMVLRDYHADNLMWLPKRAGTDKVGLLDFQDAVRGSAAYDMVSLLEDARRDVSPATVEAMISRYIAGQSELSRKDFLAAYSILGAQRNCKIIGFCARKSMRDSNSSYLSLLARVWDHIDNDLRHPLLLPLKQWFRKVNNQSAENGASVSA